jgi:hypothetical protein
MITVESTEPIPIRGHHLKILHLSYMFGKKETERIYMEIDENGERYADTKDHPIIDANMSLIRAVQNPKSRFELINNIPDSVCNACTHPRKKRNDSCFYGCDDVEIATKYGLEIGMGYTSEEILSAIDRTNPF